MMDTLVIGPFLMRKPENADGSESQRAIARV
jgi:hypothetical protein